MWVRFLGQEDPLKKGMAIPSSILAYGQWSPVGSVHGVTKELNMTEATEHFSKPGTTDISGQRTIMRHMRHITLCPIGCRAVASRTPNPVRMMKNISGYCQTSPEGAGSGIAESYSRTTTLNILNVLISKWKKKYNFFGSLLRCKLYLGSFVYKTFYSKVTSLQLIKINGKKILHIHHSYIVVVVVLVTESCPTPLQPHRL